MATTKPWVRHVFFKILVCFICFHILWHLTCMYVHSQIIIFRKRFSNMNHFFFKSSLKKSKSKLFHQKSPSFFYEFCFTFFIKRFFYLTHDTDNTVNHHRMETHRMEKKSLFTNFYNSPNGTNTTPKGGKGSSDGKKVEQILTWKFVIGMSKELIFPKSKTIHKAILEIAVDTHSPFCPIWRIFLPMYYQPSTMAPWII